MHGIIQWHRGGVMTYGGLCPRGFCPASSKRGGGGYVLGGFVRTPKKWPVSISELITIIGRYCGDNHVLNLVYFPLYLRFYNIFKKFPQLFTHMGKVTAQQGWHDAKSLTMNCVESFSQIKQCPHCGCQRVWETSWLAGALRQPHASPGGG